jgi:hypothetical protein
MKRLVLPRRTFLRGLGGAMLALPVLDCMMDSHGQALAQGRPLPKRFGVFFWGNGVRLDRWVPAQTGPGYTLSPELAPLQPVKDYINVISNYQVYAAGPRGHHDGVSGMLSGVEFIELPHPTSNYSSKFGGPSIDNILHADLGIPQSKPVLNLRTANEIVDGEGPTLQFISHKGPDEPQPTVRSPATIWQQLFGDFEVDPDAAAADPRNSLRTSVLDLVRDDITRLQGTLGTNDRRRLDAHLTGVSELRSRILALPPELTGSCAIPDEVTASGGSLREVIDLQADLLAMAFACDLRQIATIQFTGSVGFTVFPGMSAGHHDLTHQDIPEAQDNVHATTVHTMECFSSLMQKMRAMPEGAGNVLDNSLWLATSDLSEGLTHSVADYPIVLAGGAGGAMRTPGVHVRGERNLGFRKNTNDVLMTILRAMGSPRQSIGSGATASSSVVSEVLA